MKLKECNWPLLRTYKMTVEDKSLLVKISDLEWLAFYPKSSFSPEELSILLEQGFKITYYMDGDTIYAYSMWEDDDTCLVLNNVAVHPSYQTLGFGSKLVDDLKAMLTPSHIGIYAPLTDEYLEAGKFLKKNGFEYISTTHPDEDPNYNYYNLFFENPNYEGEVYGDDGELDEE
jgi:GNAT superfamily N-acetyltransferase